MLSFDVHKGFAVAWISRQDLKNLGLSDEQVGLLSDHAMHRICYLLEVLICDGDYWDDVKESAIKVLMDKEAHHGLT